MREAVAWGGSIVRKDWRATEGPGTYRGSSRWRCQLALTSDICLNNAPHLRGQRPRVKILSFQSPGTGLFPRARPSQHSGMVCPLSLNPEPGRSASLKTVNTLLACPSTAQNDDAFVVSLNLKPRLYREVVRTVQ